MSDAEQVLMCTFLVGGRQYGVEAQLVLEVLRAQEMTPVPLAPPVILGLINLRGQIVTAFDLRKRLGLEPRAGEQEPAIVVISLPDGPISLVVDEIGDVVEVETTRFEPPPDNLQATARSLLKGVFKLDSGLLLALDPERCVQLESNLVTGSTHVHGQ